MKVIVGLGNFGAEYRRTRHNVGFMVLEMLVSANRRLDRRESVVAWKLSKRTGCEEASVKLAACEDVIFAKPRTMMNRSGEAVKKLLKFYKVKPENLLVIHDDLDLRLGEWKLQFGKGPKLHRGLLSIETALGTKDFWRLRVGVDNRKFQIPNSKFQMTGEEYVLGDFLPKERVELDRLMAGKLKEEIHAWRRQVAGS